MTRFSLSSSSWLPFFGLSLLIISTNLVAVTGGTLDEDEVACIDDFKLLTDVEEQVLEWQQDSDTACSWKTVVCDSSSTHILEIILEHTDISGRIPDSIVKLSQLQKLWLAHNRLEGDVSLMPVFTMQSLEELYLYDNNLEGQLGDFTQMGRLERLYLQNNNITGTIPYSISALHGSLRYLYLNNNELNGTIPSSLGQLTYLVDLQLSHNSFSEIPASFASLTRLQYAYLFNNDFHGNLPNCFQNMTSLVDLYLHNNFYECPLDELDFSNCTELTNCDMRGNLMCPGGDFEPCVSLIQNSPCTLDCSRYNLPTTETSSSPCLTFSFLLLLAVFFF